MRQVAETNVKMNNKILHEGEKHIFTKTAVTFRMRELYTPTTVYVLKY